MGVGRVFGSFFLVFVGVGPFYNNGWSGVGFVGVGPFMCYARFWLVVWGRWGAGGALGVVDLLMLGGERGGKGGDFYVPVCFAGCSGGEVEVCVCLVVGGLAVRVLFKVVVRSSLWDIKLVCVGATSVCSSGCFWGAGRFSLFQFVGLVYGNGPVLVWVLRPAGVIRFFSVGGVHAGHRINTRCRGLENRRVPWPAGARLAGLAFWRFRGGTRG